MRGRPRGAPSLIFEGQTKNDDGGGRRSCR